MYSSLNETKKIKEIKQQDQRMSLIFKTREHERKYTCTYVFNILKHFQISQRTEVATTEYTHSAQYKVAKYVISKIALLY